MGGAGSDGLIGGTGSDWASYGTAATGLTINLATAGGTGDALGDTALECVVALAAFEAVARFGADQGVIVGGPLEILDAAVGITGASPPTPPRPKRLMSAITPTVEAA